MVVFCPYGQDGCELSLSTTSRSRTRGRLAVRAFASRLLRTSPRSNHSSPSRRRLDADLLTRDEVEAVLDHCSPESWTGLRNRTLIVVLWRTGLRISEALALREKDVDTLDGRIVVQRGKGGKRRVIGLDKGTAEALRSWAARRKEIVSTSNAPVFCTKSGGPIDASYVRRLLPRLARDAAVDKRFHAHGLRHLFATELQAEGAPISMIRDLLGHSTVATTDTYLRRLGAGEAIDFARQRTWEGRAPKPGTSGR